MVSSNINLTEYVMKALKLHNPELQFFLHPDKNRRCNSIIYVKSDCGIIVMQDIWLPTSWEADVMNTEILIPVEEGGYIEIFDWNEAVYEQSIEDSMPNEESEM